MTALGCIYEQSCARVWRGWGDEAGVRYMCAAKQGAAKGF